MISVGEMKEKLCAGNQQHLLQFWKDLDLQEQQSFMEQLSTIDFDKVNKVFQTAQKQTQSDVMKLDDHMKPIPTHQFETENGLDAKTIETYRYTGLTEISQSHVAVLLLAGGQGTRLGVNYPKGMFPLDLPSGKTLFQIQAERIRRVTRLAEEKTGKLGKICWYIMTSPATHEATESYLEKHTYFGLNKEDVVLFQQGLFPCFDFDGKIILDEKNAISMAPDGNGGIYAALTKNNIVEDMKRRGIQYVHVHSVDNILVKVADPVFIGYFTKKGADCGAKVIPKKDPHEPVGVVCQVNGRIRVVEYSEITDRTANLRNEEGTLVFNAGSICNHIFTVDFLEKVSLHHEHELKLHVAKKKISHISVDGKKVHPTRPNGIKIEKFIFDAFEFSENFVTWEVSKFSEFSPLKNCDEDLKNCPFSCRKDLLNLHRSYIENAGGIVLSEEVEISPLLSYAGENLTDRVQPITTGQLCANGKKEDACKGDSGGPLINQTLDIDGELRNFQIGVVSFASTLTCGIAELPPIYTRVDKYLEWIANNVE
ncbi:unnamed protein product [Phaedon cochleariae]|uniref:UDP-N-acetylglucosamine diphosphorylase n=1 Tax=Phaedon cochleariae TaxID=80249 RepID=A0A9N9S8J4_PHACE|nr:unnamed protein product [Phaedon cochleariae]